MSDELTYEEMVAIWLRDYIDTMDEGYLRPGDRSGDELPGIKIMFDGYGYNEETNNHDDENIMTFCIFIHKDSLSGHFPDHEENSRAIIHRPTDEVCIKAVYDVQEDYLEVLPFEESESTELDHDFIYKLIQDIHEKFFG